MQRDEPLQRAWARVGRSVGLLAEHAARLAASRAALANPRAVLRTTGHHTIKVFSGDGRLHRTRDIYGLTEDQALERAAREPYAEVVELWRDGKLIWRFEPVGGAVPESAPGRPAE